MIDPKKSKTSRNEKPKVNLGDLSGEDSNVFFILDKCRIAAENAGWNDDKIAQFDKEAKSSDYNNALKTVNKYFNATYKKR